MQGTRDLLDRLLELSPGRTGLDAGCGAGAVALAYCRNLGCRVYGLDAVERNIALSRELHPELKSWLMVHDLREELPFPDCRFDFVMCNAVIQHLEPPDVEAGLFPELARVLKSGGVFQLMFKPGRGRLTVFDQDHGLERRFNLFTEAWIIETLGGLGLDLVEGHPTIPGGLVRYEDRKDVLHCVAYFRAKG